MLHSAFRHARHNAVGLLALFVALGGTSFAAVTTLRANSVGSSQLRLHAVTHKKIAANAVGSEQIRLHAVTHKKIAANSVTTGDVKDHSLLARDFAAGQLQSGPQGATGPVGPQGPRGAQGPQGDTSVKPFRTGITAAGTDPSTAAEVVLGTDGPISLIGKCYTSGGNIHAESYLRTTVAAVNTDYGSGGQNSPLAPGTDNEVGYPASAAPGTPDLEGPFDGTWAATPNDGSVYMTGLNSNGVNLGGHDCFFGGYTVTG